MFNKIKKLSTVRIVAIGFAVAILMGSALLMLPCCIRDGVTLHYIDALYTSTSAVCVTGLIAVDAGDTFTPLGQFFLGFLIQIGGLGVTAVGVGVIVAVGKRVDLRGRNIIKDAMNLTTGKGMVKFIKGIFLTTIVFELTGALLSSFVFIQDYPPLKAAGISLFHSVAAFNNSGFDILGGFQNLIPYRNNVFLNLVTCILIFFGGIGFLVINKRNDHKKVQVEKVFYAHENRDFSESDTYRDGDTADKAYRRRHMAGSIFLQRFSENGRFFYLSSWQIFRPGAAYPDHSDVYRRFAGFYGRRHKDQYIFCTSAGN